MVKTITRYPIGTSGPRFDAGTSLTTRYYIIRGEIRPPPRVTPWVMLRAGNGRLVAQTESAVSHVLLDAL